jgi:hypothetical protein
MWHIKRREIEKNNQNLKKSILNARNLIPFEHQISFNKLLSHIDAFEIHLEDPTISYTENQFPIGIIDVVESNAK